MICKLQRRIVALTILLAARSCALSFVLVPRKITPHPSTARIDLFGATGRTSAGTSTTTRAVKKLKNNAVLRTRIDQYNRGAITAADLVQSLVRDVVPKTPGCDLEDVVTASLEQLPDKHKRDLLLKASEARTIGPGGSTASRTQPTGVDVIVNGQQGQYLMRLGGQRVSSGKSRIAKGEEVGKEGAPLKLKVTTRSKSSSAMAEVTNLSLIRARNGASLFSRHFVGFVEYVDNYNNRGDVVMVMRAGKMDMRKLAEANRGSLERRKFRKYALEMAAVVRCLQKARVVWTDFKLDNLVLCDEDEVKAIDLESAVSSRSAPKAYTPSALPPDVALASQDGFNGVKVDCSFDVWSLGMAILHLYLGKNYFEGRTDSQILTQLSHPDFEVDLAGVRDRRLRSLLEGLLDRNPSKRLQFFNSPITRLVML